MHMERLIREPASLDAAEMVFVQWVQGRGYAVIGPIASHWQTNLFSKQMDVLVTAKARRVK